jgi:hypothetical protein
MKLTQYLVRLYPKQWRGRYEEEFLAMLEQRPISLLDSVDLLLGALDAYLHPALGTAALSLPERIKQMLSALRRSLLTIFCAYIGFIIAGMGFQKLTEDRVFVEAAQGHSVMGFSFQLVVIGAVAALLAMLAGGLPIVSAIVKAALVRKRYSILLLLATPIFALIAFIGITLLLEATIPVSASQFENILSMLILLAAFLGAAVVSTGSVCFAVARSEIPPRLLHFAVIPSLLTTLSMAITWIATLAWGLSLHSSVPHLFESSRGIMRTSTSASWLEIVVMMALATVLATVSLVRSLSARSALRAIEA